jgi:hypothetical protein
METAFSSETSVSTYKITAKKTEIWWGSWVYSQSHLKNIRNNLSFNAGYEVHITSLNKWTNKENEYLV